MGRPAKSAAPAGADDAKRCARMMSIRIEYIDTSRLAEYVSVPMTYEVTSVFEVKPVHEGLGGFAFREKPVTPYQKDCNMYGDASPMAWPDRFNVNDWGVFMAYQDSQHVGGVAVAAPADGIIVTEGRTDTAALWDIRVAPSYRRGGIGMQLLRHAAEWSRKRGFTFLAIETMNVNVPACRLYAKAGAELSEVRRFGYEGCAQVAHESMIVWRMRL